MREYVHDSFRDFLRSYELGDVILPAVLVLAAFGGAALLSLIAQAM